MSASSFLRGISDIAGRVAPSVGGDAGIALGWAALGAELIADIVDAGHNPHIVLPRLRSYLPEVEEVRRRRQEAIDEKFP